MTFPIRPVVGNRSIPSSSAVAQLNRSADGSLVATVRCGPAGHRLFDVYEADVFVEQHSLFAEAGRQTHFAIERLCPQCATANTVAATAIRGIPVGPDGDWKCSHCGAYLGRLHAPRGRLTLRCAKCRSTPGDPKRDIGVTVADVFATVRDAAARLEIRRQRRFAQLTIDSDPVREYGDTLD